MPVGDCQAAVARAALDDGVALTTRTFTWLNQRGHLGLPPQAASVVPVMQEIYLALGGDLNVLATARTTPLPNDFFHPATGHLVEVDEEQHFTSHRGRTLPLYPTDAPLGFDQRAYERLCQEHFARADRYRRNKEARGFGVGGSQRRRAYYDALRDLAAPAMGHPGVIRIAAPEGDGRTAWRRARSTVLPLVTSR